MYVYIYIYILLFYSMVLSEAHRKKIEVTGQLGEKGNHVYSSIPLQHAGKHSDIYLQFCI